MHQFIMITVLFTQLLLPFLQADCECAQRKEIPTTIPTICMVDDASSMLAANTISRMLRLAGYEHEPSKISIHKSQKNQIAIVETIQGKKFVKIKKRGEGINEYLGAFLLKDLVPIIPTEKIVLSQNFELVIQPFLPLAEKRLLFQKISDLEIQDDSATWTLIQSIFADSLKLSHTTMHDSIGSAKNDDFFFNRLKTLDQDGISGRIERIYKGKIFKLMDLELSWDELKNLNWNIDGVSYQETLAELLTNARQDLDVNKRRLRGISHGNWHENNIVVNEASDEYAYFALEFAGENDLIADAIMFLTHTSVYADYLNPVYYSKAYGNHPLEEDVLKNLLQMKKRNITVNKSENALTLIGVGSFGTLKSRKQVAQLFHEQYFHPLVKIAIERFGQEILSKIDHHAKAALLLRLLGGQDVSRMTPQDQVKMIGLIYKSIGTPITGVTQESAVHCFIQAL